MQGSFQLKYILYLPLIMFVATLILMVIDYADYPPMANSLIGNQEGSLLYGPLIVLAELVVFMAICFLGPGQASAIRATVLLVLLLPWTIYAYFYSIHGGGIVALHAYWLTGLSIVIGVYLLLLLLQKLFFDQPS
jgi:hypothetical protein